LVQALQVLELLIPHVEESLLIKVKISDNQDLKVPNNCNSSLGTERQIHSFQIVGLIPSLLVCIQHPYCAVRHMSARCIGALSKSASQQTLKHVINDVVPLMATGDNVIKRQGAIEAINRILESDDNDGGGVDDDDDGDSNGDGGDDGGDDGNDDGSGDGSGDGNGDDGGDDGGDDDDDDDDNDDDNDNDGKDDDANDDDGDDEDGDGDTILSRVNT